uniref:Uncharacterized protein n=1 Tax=Chenopodium quinoa TaxID=63459 RepID=A0A803MLV5_CHEQI
MENKASSKTIMLVTLATFALVLMLQIHTGEGACPAAYDDPCTTPNTLCCPTDPTLQCVEVADMVYKCKDDPICEDHAGHECYPGYFDCCPGLTCATNQGGGLTCQ